MKCEIPQLELPQFDRLSERDGACPVDWALQAVTAAADAACGQTTVCRDGLAQLKAILTDISSGKGRGDDLLLLEDLCAVIVADGDCPLSVSTAEAVLSCLRSHTDEWEKHCVRKLCSAMVCKGCYSVYIDPALCNGCGICLSKVKGGAISGDPGLIHVVREDEPLKALDLGGCCPSGALKKAGAVKPQVPDAPVPVGSFTPAGGLLRRRRGISR